MAYRYPPPSIGKLHEQVAPPFTHVMNFNIPPPGFGSSYGTEEPKEDFCLKPHGNISKDNINFKLYPPPFANEQPKQDVCFQHYIPQVPQQSSFGDTPFQSLETTESAKAIPHSAQKSKIRRVKKRTPHTLKLYEARQLLQRCLKNLEELQGLQKILKLEYQDLSSSSWIEKCDRIKNLKMEIDTSLKKLDNPTTLKELKKVLAQRSKKRKREKRKRAQRQEKVAESRRRRAQLHESINNWLKDMQDVVEKAKREESLKHEADQVLSEVTRRKTEARKQLNMLRALQKLRRIRAQTLANQGQRVNLDSGIRFARVVEHLVKLWEDQLKEYEIEEQGLRVMLEEAVEERNKSEVVQIKQTLQQWEELLFGKRAPFNEFYQVAERDEEAFIAIRKSWDQFVAPAGAVMSSSIPVGWVIPGNPSSAEWESLLSKK